MRKARLLSALLFLIGLSFAMGSAGLSQTKKSSKSDDEIKREIIKESIANYPGNCPCPYNADRAGRRCGGRSAYSRPGGASPICYPADVTAKMVADYRKRTGR